MAVRMNLSILSMAQFAGNGDNAIRHGMLGIFSREEDGGHRQGSNIVDLYDELRPSLYGYLICLGLAPSEADDVIQEAFLELFQHLEAGGRTENLRGWVYRVAHNRSRNLQKRGRRLVSDTDADGERRSPEQADVAPNPEDIYLWKEHLERLEVAIAELTEQQRQCLHLRAEGLRYREIANVLGVGVSRVPQLLQRAMVRIMDQLYG
jgi:RNA polymerase sigma-70 factor (ECF subfamily)